MTWITKPPVGTKLDMNNTLNQGISGFWLFNEGTGSTVVNDLSGNGNTGNINGCTWVSGRAGPALSFNGSNNYISLSTLLVSGQTSDATISTLINTNSTKDFNMILGYIGSYNYIYIDLYGVTRQITLRDASGSYKNWVDNSLSTGTWYHIIITKDLLNYELWINGISKGTIPVSTINGHIQTNTIGYSTNNYFNGIIDEVRIWNKKLTNEEITMFVSNPYGMFIDTACPQVSCVLSII